MRTLPFFSLKGSYTQGYLLHFVRFDIKGYPVYKVTKQARLNEKRQWQTTMKSESAFNSMNLCKIPME